MLMFAVPAAYAEAQPAQGADAIVGTWLASEGTARVEITRAGNKFNGRIVWLKEPLNTEGQPKLDPKNPDPALRSRPLIGLNILRDFEYEGGTLWAGGRIYDPKNGKDYNCRITLANPDQLDVRGYVGVPMLGRTAVWTRVR